MGLREEIKLAKSENEITSLLLKGNGFELASPKTKSAWKTTARRRLSELQTMASAPKQVENVDEKPKTKTAKKVSKTK